MNMFLMAAQGAGGNASAAGSGWSLILMIVLMVVVFYFFMIRPQNKQRKQIEAFRASLKKGDKIITVGGIYGTIVEVKENYVLITIDENVKMRILKASVDRLQAQVAE